MSEPAPADHRVREQQMPEALVAVEAGKIEKSWQNNVYETHTRSWRVAARHRARRLRRSDYDDDFEDIFVTRR
jgi:hypothetical protein